MIQPELARLLHDLVESPTFVLAIGQVVGEETSLLIDAMRQNVRAGNQFEALRAEASINVLEDLISTLKKYADRYRV